MLHDVWDDDGLEFSDDNDIFQLHFGGGGGVRPPTPQPPTQAPTTTTSTTTAAPTTPLPTPYPGASKCSGRVCVKGETNKLKKHHWP